MLITAEGRTLTSEKRSILDVLAAQVAVEVESCRLVEEKVRLERELANREHLATLGQMAAQVAHEVKNPLSSIKSIVQVMREEDSLSGYDQDLGMIVSEIDRLNRSVSQLLAFSRPSHSDSQPVQLSDLVNVTVTLAGGEARERGVDVIVESICDVTLTGPQAGALREAFSNLVVNGVQATEAGGQVKIEAAVQIPSEDLRIRSTAFAAATLTLTVTDSGPGIQPDMQRRVFEPFYSTKSCGTGLGLAIVQRRVVEIGGSVELISPVEDDHGTRFRLRVPVAIVPSEME
jgi:signal transduction histidine kinase